MKNIIVCVLSLFVFFSCKQAVKMEEGVKVFGEDFTVENVAEFDQVLGGLDSLESVDAVMKVNVEKVCKVKGCWMTAVDPTGGDEEFFVKFKDYGFFVPVDFTDNGSQTVYIKGNAFKETTSVDELKHYAEDEGKSQEEIDQITEEEVQYKFMATGVKMI